MASLSIVMIVRNEADCLSSCLESVRTVAHEIVIADTGSTDDTVAVAERFGARVLHVPWRDDFAAARNATLAVAQGDWLLHIDADEVLEPSGREMIDELLRKDGAGADAVEVTLRNYSNDVRAWRWLAVEPGDPFARGYAGYLPVGLLRFFRNRCGFEYREPVHENITESVAERGGVVAASSIIIHHYGFETTPEKVAAKRRRYYAIARRKSSERPRDPKAWLDLAEQAVGVGETEVAEDAVRRALELEPSHLAAATTLGMILLNRGDIENARSLFEHLWAEGVRAPHVETALGAIACKQGRIDEARTYLEGVANAYPKDIQSRLYLARALERLGAMVAARVRLTEALTIAPGLSELANRLRAHELREEARLVLADREHVTEAMRLLAEALRLDPEDSLTYRALGEALQFLGHHEQAAIQFERAARLEGQRR